MVKLESWHLAQIAKQVQKLIGANNERIKTVIAQAWWLDSLLGVGWELWVQLIVSDLLLAFGGWGGGGVGFWRVGFMGRGDLSRAMGDFVPRDEMEGCDNDDGVT